MHWGQILGTLAGICSLLVSLSAGAAPAVKKTSVQSSPATVAYLTEKIGDVIWSRTDY